MNFHAYIQDKRNNTSFIIKDNTYNGRCLRFNLKELNQEQRKTYQKIREELKIPYYQDEHYTTDIQRFSQWLNKPYTHASTSIGSTVKNGLSINIFKKEQDIERYIEYLSNRKPW